MGFLTINYLPCNPHANIIRQRNNGANSGGKFDVRAGPLVSSVHIADDQSNYDQREEVWHGG